MMYADYSYYKNSFGGTMAEGDFLRCSREARAYLTLITFDRLSTLPSTDPLWDKVKDACCAVAEACLFNAQGGELASEITGNWSCSYVTTNQSPIGRMRDAARLYLGASGLLYCGVEK